MSLSHRCGGILAHSSLQNCFNSATLEGFQAWMDCLRSCHNISTGFKSGLWFGHSKTLILFLLSHSEVDLCGAGVFGIIVLLHNPSVLELEVISYSHISFHILSFQYYCTWLHFHINFKSNLFCAKCTLFFFIIICRLLFKTMTYLK